MTAATNEWGVLLSRFDEAIGAHLDKPMTLSHRSGVLMLFGLGCASLGTPGQRVTALEAEAATCEDFSEFDARARAVLDEHRRTSVDLIEANALINGARRNCARAVMNGLLSTRVVRGPDAAQQQLDAMALALPENTFARLVSELPDDPNLRAMATLAVETASTIRVHQAHGQKEQAALDAWHVDAPVNPVAELDSETAAARLRQCESLGPDAALTCLTQLAAHLLAPAERAALKQAVHDAASQKLQSLQIVPPAQRALPLGKLVAKLDALELDEPAARQALEESRRALWPDIEEASRRGRIEQAAAMAEPFIALSDAKLEVDRLREAAAAAQLEQASQSGSRAQAAAFHRRLAARFGASSVPWPTPAGQWDTSHFQCARPTGALPSAAGLSLRLVASCKRSKRSSDASQPSDPKLQTFEAERSLEWESIDGTLFVSCAGRVLSYRVSSRDLAVDTGENQSVLRDDPGIGAAPHSALSLELEKLISRAVPECRAARTQQAANDCTKMSGADAFELEERFTEHALSLKAWPSCFVHWLDAKLGVAPPALE